MIKLTLHLSNKPVQACEMNRETQDELSAAEAAMHEASATVEQVIFLFSCFWFFVFYFTQCLGNDPL